MVVGNLVYTVAAIVAAELVPMTSTGVAATLATGVYTALFAGLQYLGVRRLAANSPPRRYGVPPRQCGTRPVSAISFGSKQEPILNSKSVFTDKHFALICSR